MDRLVLARLNQPLKAHPLRVVPQRQRQGQALRLQVPHLQELAQVVA